MNAGEAERLRAHAERIRQEQEAARGIAERARVDAEKERVTAEHARNVAAGEVRGTVDTLVTLLSRMEAVEKLRRTGTGGGNT